MTDTQGTNQSDIAASQQSLASPAPPTPPAPTAPEERTFKQSEVNDIVKRAKHDAIDTYKRVSTEQPQYAQQKYGDGQPLHTAPTTASLPEDHFRKIAAEEAQRLRDTWVREAQTKYEADAAQRIVQNFVSKAIEPGKTKYQDFDSVTGDIDYVNFPNVVQLLANAGDTSHDVLYELGKDRVKMAGLESLARMSPKDAIVQLQRLSQSIKDNETGKRWHVPNEPLSQMRPSTANKGNSDGALSWSELRQKYKG